MGRPSLLTIYCDVLWNSDITINIFQPDQYYSKMYEKKKRFNCPRYNDIPGRYKLNDFFQASFSAISLTAVYLRGSIRYLSPADLI